MNTELLSRIVVSDKVLVGKPIIRGLRISVQQVLKDLSSGMRPEDVLTNHPELEPEDIQAVLLFAANALDGEKNLQVA